MDEFEKPEQIATLRDHIANGLSISAHCQTYLPTWCGHFADLNMETLVQHFGWDFEIVKSRRYFLSRLVCSKCGARFPGLILSPSRPEYIGTGGSHGRQADLLSVEEATKQHLEFLRIDRERNAALPEPYEWKGKRKGGRKFGRR